MDSEKHKPDNLQPELGDEQPELTGEQPELSAEPLEVSDENKEKHVEQRVYDEKYVSNDLQPEMSGENFNYFRGRIGQMESMGEEREPRYTQEELDRYAKKDARIQEIINGGAGFEVRDEQDKAERDAQLQGLVEENRKGMDAQKLKVLEKMIYAEDGKGLELLEQAGIAKLTPTKDGRDFYAFDGKGKFMGIADILSNMYAAQHPEDIQAGERVEKEVIPEIDEYEAARQVELDERAEAILAGEVPLKLETDEKKRWWKRLKEIFVNRKAGVVAALGAMVLNLFGCAALPGEQTEADDGPKEYKVEKYDGPVWGSMPEYEASKVEEPAAEEGAEEDTGEATEEAEDEGERIWATEYSKDNDPYYAPVGQENGGKEKAASWGPNRYYNYDFEGLMAMEDGVEKQFEMEGIFQGELDVISKSPAKAYSAMQLSQGYFGDMYFGGTRAEGNELAKKVENGEVNYDTINEFLRGLDEAVESFDVIELKGDYMSDYAKALADGTYEAGYDDYVMNHGGHVLIAMDKDGIIIFSARLECG